MRRDRHQVKSKVKGHQYSQFKNFDHIKNRSEREKWEAFKDYLRSNGWLNPALV